MDPAASAAGSADVEACLCAPREDPTVENTVQSADPSGELVASLVSRHLPDGEFGWGGISVTRQRRCPKAGSVGTELSRGTQA